MNAPSLYSKAKPFVVSMWWLAKAGYWSTAQKELKALSQGLGAIGIALGAYTTHQGGSQ